MNGAVAKYLAKIGRRGGLSRSPKKRAAGRRNIAKARRARLEKRRTAMAKARGG